MYCYQFNNCIDKNKYEGMEVTFEDIDKFGIEDIDFISLPFDVLKSYSVIGYKKKTLFKNKFIK